jgi:hypothetical protein
MRYDNSNILLVYGIWIFLYLTESWSRYCSPMKNSQEMNPPSQPCAAVPSPTSFIFCFGHVLCTKQVRLPNLFSCLPTGGVRWIITCIFGCLGTRNRTSPIGNKREWQRPKLKFQTIYNSNPLLCVHLSLKYRWLNIAINYFYDNIAWQYILNPNRGQLGRSIKMVCTLQRSDQMG